jgi:hypothetical protein
MLDNISSHPIKNWEQIIDLWENFQNNSEVQTTNIKSQAIQFCKKKLKSKFTRKDLRKLHAKIYKMKNSQNQQEKIRGQRLFTELKTIFNQ